VQCERLPAKKRFFRCTNARSQERRASARRGSGNAIAIADAFVQRQASARRWSETAFATATRWVSTGRICIPRTSHGGLTPPALVAERTFAGEKNDFCGAGTHIHKSGGASARRGFGNAVAIADGSVRRPALARRWSETAFATATRWVSTERICIPRTSHGGLTPPALVAERTFAGEENDFCGAGTHIHKSGGREPAVGMSNAIAIADAFVQRQASARRWSETAFATATRWVSTFRVRIPRTSHGGLTPPALGAVRTFAGKKRFFRCTNAGSQERRASARRGIEKRICNGE
jgi:hypothetical protein